MRECVAADLMWPKQIGINEMEIGQERPKLCQIFSWNVKLNLSLKCVVCKLMKLKTDL